MKSTCDDLRAEYRELADMCEDLTPDQWQLRTAFYDWTPFDEISHLCFFDETALQSATDPQAFERDTAALSARLATGEEISAIARSVYGHLSGAELVQHWRTRHNALVDALARLDPKDRLAWYGPTMSARSFATARLMETWAHGQDIWDAVQARRPGSARLRHIAHIGVTTFGWTFVNRGLPPPAVVPYVELKAPDGSVWTWGEPSDTDFVRGDAEGFCLVVTQRRHRDDTNIECRGDAANRWMSMAQCFAGPPVDGPAPGVRRSAA
nr:TIGR03084 family protein [Pseudomonas sp.]